MGFASHHRTLSPTGGRHHMGGPRASTGMVQLDSAYDPYEVPRGRYDYDDYYYPSDAGYPSTYRYSPSHRSRLEAQPVSSHRYRDYGQPTKKRTEYTIQPQTRPRARSNTASAADFHAPPVRLTVPSSSHLRPVVGSGRHRSPSPLPSESAPYVVPPGGRHHRVYSTDYASDTGRMESRDGVKYRHGPRSSYRAHPPTGRRRYHASEGLKNGDDIDDYDAYSYTTPREQFDRDYPVKPRYPAVRSSGGRPLSMNVMEDHPSWLGRRDHREPRHHGPPPTSWGLDKLGREERPRASARAVDDHIDAPRSRGGGSYDQALVPVPRDDSDGDYEREGDDHRRRRHRRHRHGSDRHYREDRSPRPHDDAERALPALGTAALGNGYSDMSDYDHRPVRRHSRRTHDPRRDYDAGHPPPREIMDGSPSNSDKSKPLYLEPPESHPRRTRSRGHSRRRPVDDHDRYTDDEDLEKYRQEPSAGSRCRHSSSDTSSDDGRSPGRYPRSRSHRRSSGRLLEDSHATESRYSDDHRDDARRPIAVDPPAPKEPDAAPRGILKAPRDKFPEEPNPIREGVAPLKDAHKKGIPPGARWTKIDRRLVNPEALEAGNERFEERSDYVIVLRVLSKEEIQAYAVKTQEIRG